MSGEEAWQVLDFRNEGELWLSECVYYVTFILIWYLLIRILYFFCFHQYAPRFKQFDDRSLKPLKRRAEESRVRRQSEYEQQSQSNTNTTASKTAQHPQAFGRARGESTALSSGSQLETMEEFQLQICKIHKNLRICFLSSIIFTAVSITSILMNHTLIIAGAIERDCVLTRLPVIANFCQRMSLYLFFIFRLHFSFGATQFGIKRVFIVILVVSVCLLGACGVVYFFLRIVLAPEPCEVSGFSAGAPAIGQDLLINILLSVLFLSRLAKAIKSQRKTGSVRNLEAAKLKTARKNYKYYYAMYKLTLLFVAAFLITLSGLVVVALTDLAGMVTAIDSVASNYLLYLTFQFNDLYFRKLFCGCLALQTLCLGEEYAKEMELHFHINARKAPHRQSSRTWQHEEDETRTVNRRTTVDTIQEEHEHGDDGHQADDHRVSQDSPQSPEDQRPADVIQAGGNSKDEREGTPTPQKDVDMDSQEPMMNRIYTNETDMAIDVHDTPQPQNDDQDGSGDSHHNDNNDEDGDIEFIARADTEVP